MDMAATEQAAAEVPRPTKLRVASLSAMICKSWVQPLVRFLFLSRCEIDQNKGTSPEVQLWGVVGTPRGNLGYW